MNVLDALRQVNLFRQLEEHEIELLAQQAVSKRYSRNETIFVQGESGDGLYIVESGHVGIGTQSAEGNELLLAVYEPGEYFGELALFDQAPRSASASAIDDCKLVFLAAPDFKRFLEAHPRVMITCLELVVRQVRRLTDLAGEIALLNVKTRLARRLLQLTKEGLLPAPAGAGFTASDDLRITQQQLANMLGATRESVNKHLHAFAGEGLISIDRGRVQVLDVAALERYTESFF